MPFQFSEESLLYAQNIALIQAMKDSHQLEMKRFLEQVDLRVAAICRELAEEHTVISHWEGRNWLNFKTKAECVGQVLEYSDPTQCSAESFLVRAYAWSRCPASLLSAARVEGRSFIEQEFQLSIPATRYDRSIFEYVVPLGAEPVERLSQPIARLALKLADWERVNLANDTAAPRQQ